MSLLVKNGYVVTMNPRRDVFPGGFVAVDGRDIVAIGPKGTEPARRFDDVLDASGMIVVPGLINLHQHHWYNLFKGLAGGLILEDWVGKVLLPCGRRLTPEDLKASAYLAALEMLRTGTTTCLNHSVTTTMEAEVAATIEPMAEIGFRQVFAKDFRCKTPANAQHPHDSKTAAAYIGGLIDKWNGARDGLVHMALTIESNAHWIAAGMSSEELIATGWRLARDKNLRITNHAAGGTLSLEKGYLKHVREMGRTDVGHLAHMGVLDDRWLLIHVINLNDADVELMKRARCHAVYTPTSESMRGGGVGPWVALYRAGINVALGTDGPMVDYSVDMVEQMKAALVIQNVKHLDPTVFSPERVLEMATINAARALGMEKEIGSLEAGKRADLVALDMRAPHLQVAHNPIANFVCCARGADAHTVVVNGRTVLKDGRFAFTGVDDVIRDATARARRIAEAAGILGAAAPSWPKAAA